MKASPEAGSQESHGEGNGSFVQDLSWLIVGWLYGTRPEGLPYWHAPGDAKQLCYIDRTTAENSVHASDKLWDILFRVASYDAGQCDRIAWSQNYRRTGVLRPQEASHTGGIRCLLVPVTDV